MNAIYAPTGRAREYAELACNLYRGCGHGCTYCYAPAVLHMTREEFNQAAMPRKGILEALRKDAAAYRDRGDNRRVLLCFTCDPYPPSGWNTTTEAIGILQDHEVKFDILTKGGFRTLFDYDLLADRRDLCRVATTLTGRDDLEPRAAPNLERVAMLEYFHSRGFETWVSIEPVIDPDFSLACIREAAPHCDQFRIGKLNHDPQREAEIDWRDFGERAVKLCEQLGKSYILKRDLREAMA